MVTINGQEATEGIIGGTLTAVSLFLAFKKDDKESFSRALGALGLGAAVTLNPVVLCFVIVAVAIGYRSLVCRKALGRGAIVTAAAAITSAAIPGPLLLGVLPAIIVSIYLNKKLGKDFDIEAHVSGLWKNLKDPALREKLIAAAANLAEKMKTLTGNGERERMAVVTEIIPRKKAA